MEDTSITIAHMSRRLASSTPAWSDVLVILVIIVVLICLLKVLLAGSEKWQKYVISFQ